MTPRDQQILVFLRSRAEGPALEKARSFLESLKQELDLCENPHFDGLVRRRILASTSLSRKLEERSEWDQSNAFVAQAIEEGRPLDFEAVAELNGRLTKSAGQVRTVSVYAGDEEYLSLDALPKALEIFEEITGTSDPVLRAALIYIFVINAHPFVNGNGRTARLAADWVLLDNGFPPLCFPTSVQSHVAYAQSERYPSLSDCILKCYGALANSFFILLGRAP